MEGNETIFRVTVPDGVEPGQEFQVHAGGRVLRVRCPPTSRPGDAVQMRIPVAPSSSQERRQPDPNVPPDSPGVTKIEDDGNAPAAYKVVIPPGIQAGQQFPVMIAGQQLILTSPANARPGDKVRIVPPPALTMNDETEMQLFEIQVPPGVMPGDHFALLAGGVRVVVACPINSGPGQRIRFKLPRALTRRNETGSELGAIKSSYDKDGWARTIRVSDLKFQWIRFDERGDVDTSTCFDTEKSAYVRKLVFCKGADPRIRNGVLSLVPANEAFLDSYVKGQNGRDLVTYADIANAQFKDFENKVSWFQEKCDLLRVDWNEGHMRINVRREHLLEDSVDAVMSLSPKNLRMVWRFEFIGEMGIDDGGLAREWFRLVTEEIFNPDMGLWQFSETNQMCLQINPASHQIHNEHLMYYRFLGRVIGKALFDRQLVAGHMARYIYKHMLGWPITFKDIKSVDEECYNKLRQLQELASSGEDLSMLDIDFSTTQEFMGVKEGIDLVEGGRNIKVTNDNFSEYLEANLKYHMLDRVKPQLNELLLGCFDVIPEPLLTVFDFQELELLLSGLPEIDLEDWKEHTEYSGDYANTGIEDPVCQWFWEVVEEFDQEMKARLLQFVTGTSGVPIRGFGFLRGNDGNIRKLNIHGVSMDVGQFPRAHMSSNRIDLPNYPSKDDLREDLKLVMTMEATGFDIT